MRPLRLWGDRIAGTLEPDFYARDTLTVARELLGKLLVVRSNPACPLENPRARVTVARIVETEGYHGDDPASHCSRGETPRCAIMFGDPGLAYVYFIYGNYEMLNFVTEARGTPGAVLVRAVEPVSGLELMRRRRKTARKDTDLTNGPGRLCQAMGIRMAHKGAPLWGPELYVVDDGAAPGHIACSPRVGIKVGTESLWRYWLEGNPYLSKAPQNAQAIRHPARRGNA